MKTLSSSMHANQVAGPGVFRQQIVITILREEINRLMMLKATGNEADRGPQSPLVNQFIESEVDRLSIQTQSYQNTPAPFEVLDNLFRAIWQQIEIP